MLIQFSGRSWVYAVIKAFFMKKHLEFRWKVPLNFEYYIKPHTHNVQYRQECIELCTGLKPYTNTETVYTLKIENKSVGELGV